MNTYAAEGSSFIVTASWLFTPGQPPLEGGALHVVDGVIREVAPLSELKRRCDAPVIEYPDCVILPGFANAHTHLELTHSPSWRLKAGMDYHPKWFVDWIIQLIKVKRSLTPDDYRASVQEGMRICLESGTILVGDILSNPTFSDCYCHTPLSGRLFHEVLGQDPVRFAKMLDKAVETALGATPDNFRAGLSPHAPYTIADANYPAISAAGRSAGLPFSIHLSESREEVDFVFGTSGQMAEVFYPYVAWDGYLMPPRKCTSTDLLDRNNMLTPGTMAIHCVHVNPADVEILKRRGVHAVLCPRSNERLNVGHAPVALLKKAGIPLALGTDSLASNDSLSMWDEMRFALKVYAGALNAEELLEMATVGGAAALGVADRSGLLTAGRQADFQVASVAGRPGTPDRLVDWLLAGGGTEEVYVSGKRVVVSS